jgi:hypothetical protein
MLRVAFLFVLQTSPRQPAIVFVCERDAAKSVIITAHFNKLAAERGLSYQSILELAKACDVPVRWSCRTGVCHNSESGLVSGAVVYGPEPLDKPAG